MSNSAVKVRVDKWLWAVRLFKSRSIASEVCRQGHVKSEGKSLKPSGTVSVGDQLIVRRNGYNMVYEVLQTIEKRVGAPSAITCYRDLTPEAELRKFDPANWSQAPAELRERGQGRPTKRERREIDQFKDVDDGVDWGWVDDEDDEED